MLFALLFSFLIGSAQAAPVCAPGTELSKLTDIITPSDKFQILDGDKLDLFIKNANDLYNIGWVRSDIDKVYVVEAEIKADNRNFQVEHVFFINKGGCIAYYQTAYKAVIDLLLSPKPCEVLGITCQ